MLGVIVTGGEHHTSISKMDYIYSSLEILERWWSHCTKAWMRPWKMSTNNWTVITAGDIFSVLKAALQQSHVEKWCTQSAIWRNLNNQNYVFSCQQYVICNDLMICSTISSKQAISCCNRRKQMSPAMMGVSKICNKYASCALTF